MSGDMNIIEATGIVNRFGSTLVHDNLNLSVKRGEIIGLVGGSGAGKTVLLRTLVGLHRADAGRVLVDGKDIAQIHAAEKARIMGVLFQHGALFSALNVLQNVMAPITEHFNLTPAQAAALARLKIALANLPPEAGDKYPSELSGGMIKRAALARAMALDPQVLFLDEPTSGLDPIAANESDNLVQNLNRDLGITFVIVTHDLDTLSAICHRVAVLVDRKVIVDTLDNLILNDHPWIKTYFQGARAHKAFQRRG